MQEREYIAINVHKKCTKLTPEELKAIALMSLVTLLILGPAIMLSEKEKHSKVQTVPFSIHFLCFWAL